MIRLRNKFLADPPVPEHQKYVGIIEFPGFHTTDSKEIAAMYAIGRVNASFTEEDENGVNYVTDYPVVVALDMSGLKKHTDYDAEKIVKEVLETHLNELIEYEKLAVTSSDDEILDATDKFTEFTEYSNNYSDSAIEMISQQIFSHINNPIYNIMQQDYYPDFVRNYIKSKVIPGYVLMDAVDQYRYTEDIDSSRIQSIYYVQPVANMIMDYDSNEKELEAECPGFDIPWVDDVYGMSYYPVMSKEFEVDNPVEEVEYHGTTYLRLLSAAPELRKILPKPPSPPYV